MSQLLEWVMKSKGAKITGGLVGGSGAFTLVFYMLNAQIEQVHASIIEKDYSVRQYVDSKHDVVMSEVGHLSKGQKEIKELLKIIDKRLYDMKSKSN